MTLTDFQEELCRQSRWDFSGLSALFVNCTLKPSPELSHTEGLMRISVEYLPFGSATHPFGGSWRAARIAMFSEADSFRDDSRIRFQ